MEMELNPTVFAKFKAFEIKNIEAVKGGDGEDDPGDGIGTSDLGDI